MSKPKPPPGYDSWLAYIVATVQNHKMRPLVQAELDALVTIEGCAAGRLECIERLECEIEELKAKLRFALEHR